MELTQLTQHDIKSLKYKEYSQKKKRIRLVAIMIRAFTEIALE